MNVVRRRGAMLSAGLVLANIAAWAWAGAAFHGNPALLGTALLAYGFGLRHAVDADHIAAIDNVTRKLVQDGRRPVAVGCFFALGHSSVVLVVATVIAATAITMQQRFPLLASLGGALGTLISAGFLLAIAAVNAVVLMDLVRRLRRARQGGGGLIEAPAAAAGGPLAWVLRCLFRLISRSWQMYFLGLLFGLGFDTASEVGLLGIAASQAAQGLPLWGILIFPALFAAAMSLIDTADGMLMLGAYGWAFRNPLRKLYYNVAVTGISVAIAVLVGGIEVLGLIGDKFGLSGGLWDAVGAAADRLDMLGYAIIALFSATWMLALLLYAGRYRTREG